MAAELQQALLTLAASATPVVSCDVFDTLIFRRCGSPDDLFRQVAKNAMATGVWSGDDPDAFVAERRYAEEYARQQQHAAAGHREVTLVEIYAAWPAVNGPALMALEQDTEYQNWFLNDALAAALVEKAQAGTVVYLLSDMYLPAALIRRFFAEHCAGLPIADVWVSGEMALSKTDGGLYQRLLAQGHSKVLHIGDHPVADGQMARAAGLETLPVPFGQYLRQLDKWERRLQGEPTAELLLVRKHWLWHNQHANDLAETAGLVFGPVLYCWAQWLVSRCQALGITTLYCLLREGALLATVLKALPHHTLSVHTLAISRRASWLPAKGRCGLAELQQLATRRSYTLGELAQDLGLSLPDGWPAAQTLAITQRTSQWSALCRWITDHQLAIDAHLQQQRQALQFYLQQQGVTNRADIGLVDWGCGGSLFSSLNAVTPLFKTRCFMFYRRTAALAVARQQPLEVYQPSNAQPWADAIAAFPELAEIMLNGNHLSTRSYTAQGDPVSADTPTDATQQAMLNAVQDAIVAFTDSALRCDWQPTHSPRQRHSMLALLYRLVAYPSTAEARAGQMLRMPGLADSLLPPQAVMAVKQRCRDADSAHHLGLAGNTQLVKEAYWYPGLVALAFPASNGTFGELQARQDDDHVAPMLVATLQEKAIREVAVYGAGEIGSQVCQALEEAGIRICAVVDQRAEQYPFSLCGYPVQPLSTVIIQRPPPCFVIASRAFAEAIAQRLHDAYQSQPPLILGYGL